MARRCPKGSKRCVSPRRATTTSCPISWKRCAPTAHWARSAGCCEKCSGSTSRRRRGRSPQAGVLGEYHPTGDKEGVKGHLQQGGPPHPNLLPRGEGTIGPPRGEGTLGPRSAPSVGFGFSPGRTWHSIVDSSQAPSYPTGDKEGIKGHLRQGGPPHPNLLPRGEGTIGPRSAPSVGFGSVAHGFSPGRTWHSIVDSSQAPSYQTGDK